MSEFSITQLDLDEVARSQRRLQDYIHRTPVLTSNSLNQRFGCELFFKAEHLQKTGAFKYRGASNAVLQLDPAVTGVATHSSGNHGAALAAAARRTERVAHIVMPDNSIAAKTAAVKAYGGQIHFCEPTQQSRETALQALVEQGHHAVHPYDDWRIIFGQSTATAELITEISDLDVVIAPVGGGGLISGACLAVQADDQPIQVVAAEPAGAADSYQSLQQGQRITSIKPDTIADGLRATVGERNFAVMQAYLQQVVLVDDSQIMQALGLVWRHTKQLIEPSCATVVAALAQQPDLFTGKRVGVILSGGNVDIDRLLSSLE